MDNIKDYFQAVLVGSFTFGSVFPLVFRTVSDLLPTVGSSIIGQIRLFYAVNIVYFVGPLMFGLLAWWFLQKNHPDDLLFKEDFLSFQNGYRQVKWQPRLRNIPIITLLLLIAFGLWVMQAMSNPFHGPIFIGALFIIHVLITISMSYLSWLLFKRLIWCPNRKLIYFNRFASQICTQWLLGLLLSSSLFAAATLSFFYEHEGTYLWNAFENTDSPKDALLRIDMPFRWEKTANEIKASLIDPFTTCFNDVSTEANLLAASQLDYNDIAIRIKPDTGQQRLIDRTLPLKSADSLRSMLLIAYQRVKELTGSNSLLRYTDSGPLDAYLEKINQSKQVALFQNCYSLSLDSIQPSLRHSSILLTPTMQLLRANQLMPLADNFVESADVIRQSADKQSRSLLAQWVKISRIKGLFFLSTFLNLLLCTWFVIRLANEAFVRTTSSPKSESPPKQYRELINLRYYISLTVLLILPLFRTIDETSISSNHPYWFLDLPQLVGNVVEPLPNTNSTGNFGGNEVTNRLEQLNKQVKSLTDTAKKLEKVSGTTRSDLNDMKY
ncbi:hypothetical protein [Spirosoma flavum]|uniref:Uncharacterized protein n=1 Tax=Spirosoma flavum TaxID=2048557 RepID=A0ABW6AKZ8_9BACT